MSEGILHNVRVAECPKIWTLRSCSNANKQVIALSELLFKKETVVCKDLKEVLGDRPWPIKSGYQKFIDIRENWTGRTRAETGCSLARQSRQRILISKKWSSWLGFDFKFLWRCKEAHCPLIPGQSTKKFNNSWSSRIVDIEWRNQLGKNTLIQAATQPSVEIVIVM